MEADQNTVLHRQGEALPYILMPCPFCGSTSYSLIADVNWFVRCKDCKAEGPRSDGPHPGERLAAVELWNRRGQLAALDESGTADGPADAPQLVSDLWSYAEDEGWTVGSVYVSDDGEVEMRLKKAPQKPEEQS